MSLNKALSILFCLIFAGIHQAQAQDDPRPVTVKTKRSSLTSRSLPHLIALAEEHSPNILLAHEVYENARLAYEIANRAWLPSLDASTANGLKNPATNLPQTSAYTSQLDLTLTQNIYDNGKTFTTMEITERAFDRAKVQYELSRDTQLVNLAGAYYDWSAALKQRDVLENKRDLLRRQFNVLEAQYKQGLKTKRDVLRIETEIRRLELDVIDGDNAIDLDYQKVAALAGLSRDELDEADIEAEEAKPYAIGDFKADELKAKNHRQAQIYSYLEKEAALGTYLAQRNYWPQVSMTGEAGYHDSNYLYNSAYNYNTGQYWDYAAVVTLTYNLWDFGTRSRQIEVARVAERTQADKDHQGLFDLQNTLRDVNNQLRAFAEDVRLTRELLVLEQQSYSILEAEYRNGRANYLDLITDLNNLVDARSRYNSSYFGLKKQQANYLYHRGELYDSFKEEE